MKFGFLKSDSIRVFGYLIGYDTHIFGFSGMVVGIDTHTQTRKKSSASV